MAVTNRKMLKTVEKVLLEVDQLCKNLEDAIQTRCKKTLLNFEELLSQIPQSVSSSIQAKTPKIIRKRNPRIETIPEDSVMELGSNSSTMDEISESFRKPKRKASQVASNNIRKQSTRISSKAGNKTIEHKRQTRKQTQLHLSSSASSEDECLVNASKKICTRSLRKELDATLEASTEEERPEPQTVKKKSSQSKRSLQKRKRDEQESGDRTFVASIEEEPVSKKQKAEANESGTSQTDDPSLYEDAIGKNILSSTMNASALAAHKKVMCASVMLVPLPHLMSNNTFVVQKPNARSSPLSKRNTRSSKKSVDSLITDDESSPERKLEKKKPAPNKVLTKKPNLPKRVTRSSTISSDEDQISPSPKKNILRDQNSKLDLFKTPGIISPYTKDLVKSRVQAYEQANQAGTPQEITPGTTRVTRTKTRALAAASNVRISTRHSVSQQVARKSIAKAVKISNAKQIREKTEAKENRSSGPNKKKLSNLISTEKTLVKPLVKGTPMAKKIPMAINRLPQTPLNSYIPVYSQASASRNNIVLGMDSLIPKTTSKRDSEDRSQLEKKRKMDSEDAKRKREETMKSMMEEKKRKRELKELKNKQAREAKEKYELEKRLKAEKEKEEKVKIAQLMLEKQREEAEKKRLAKLQLFQEKEEKRKQEEQLRLRRLQEQEEAERQLAESKRLESEAEKRKMAELRAQQQLAEIKNKNQLQAQIQAAKVKPGPASKKPVPMTYKLDSEPGEDDDTDEESAPKHEIPEWAKSSVRREHLKMQMYVPNIGIKALYNAQKCTPDLTELFEGINKNRLKRTSSAIWKTPPRFSMMAD